MGCKGAAAPCGPNPRRVSAWDHLLNLHGSGSSAVERIRTDWRDGVTGSTPVRSHEGVQLWDSGETIEHGSLITFMRAWPSGQAAAFQAAHAGFDSRSPLHIRP